MSEYTKTKLLASHLFVIIRNFLKIPNCINTLHAQAEIILLTHKFLCNRVTFKSSNLEYYYLTKFFEIVGAVRTACIAVMTS